MSYETAVASMFALGHELAHTPSNKFDLAHMRILLGAMDHPERRFPSVLIAGTNGKGSTAATLDSILRASGLKTALYTSPHLMRINERIRVNGQEIGDDAFARLHGEVDRVAERLVEQGALPWHPSFFEMMTRLRSRIFARGGGDCGARGWHGRAAGCDQCGGAAGQCDYGHFAGSSKFLGNTVGEIAEKVGIIRAGEWCALPQQPQANDVIGNTILELGARGVSAVQYVPPVSPGSGDYFVSRTPGQENGDGRSMYRYPLQVMGAEILVETPLVGRHQLRNVALAIAAAEEVARLGIRGITPDSIERGIRETRWPGRFEVLVAGEGWPEVVLDVAHNPAGAWALRSALSGDMATVR